jgi:hypothetical protein
MNVKGSRWQYYSVKANSAFTLNVTSSPVKFDLYFRKGGEIPDAANFDAVIKQRNYAVVNEFFLGDYESFIFAVHTSPVQLNTPASLQSYDFQVDLEYSKHSVHEIRRLMAAPSAPSMAAPMPQDPF